MQKTVWLCFPGRKPDPCVTSLATTYVGPHGATRVEPPRAAASPPIDCFYVYPTVSDENRGNADLHDRPAPDPRRADAGRAVLAGVQGLCAGLPPDHEPRARRRRRCTRSPLLAYGDVLAAWRDYLAHWNHGRGVVLLGHSQGSYVLKHLLTTVIDRSAVAAAPARVGDPARRPGARREPGTRGGDFRHIPPCASAHRHGLRDRLLELRPEAAARRDVRALAHPRDAHRLRQPGAPGGARDGARDADVPVAAPRAYAA